MKRLALIFLLLLLSVSARAATTIITATITVTNTAGTTNGQTITVNSDTRTWTNSLVVPATQILTNNSIGGCATNLFNAISDAPFANLFLTQLTNGITLQTLPNGSLSVSLSAGWGLVALTTNTLTSAQVLRLPITVEPSAQQTNISTLLAQAEEYGTYSISQTTPAHSNFVNLGQAQTITGQKTFISPIIKSPYITNAAIDNPFLTNGINSGNAFSSPGSGSLSEQFGAFASASAPNATAFGNSAVASANSASAFGLTASASGPSSLALGEGSAAGGSGAIALGAVSAASSSNSVALGYGVNCSGTNAVSVGTQSSATALNSIALGQSSTSSNINSIAIGAGARTTDANMVALGSSSAYVAIQGNLCIGGAISNLTVRGTNNLPAGTDIAYGRFSLSTLANGNNAGVVVGTNVFAEVSGPTGAFTINGIAGGRDGKFAILLNRTGQNMTLANDSGVEPTSANRLYCLTGADKTVTGNSAALLIYNANVAHWIVLNFSQ